MLLGLGACQKGEIPNLNTPVASQIIANGTKEQIDNLAVAMESGTRLTLNTYYDAIGLQGREIYRFSGSEPRYTTELMGTSPLDNNTFYTTNPWASRYRVVRQANTLIDAVNNSSRLSAEQKKGYLGYAKTIMAYQLLLALNMQYTNGIRTDVRDPNNLGPIKGYPESLTDIANMLNEGLTDLNGAEIAFPVSVVTDVTAAKLMQFNRALAARVAVYRQQWAEALTALNGSSFNLNGDFNSGYVHIFSANSGDVLNPVFLPQNNSGEQRLAHPTYAAQIAPGDDRIAKATLRAAPASLDGLQSNRDVWIHRSNTAPVYIIRNEELILIYAEAKINLNQLPDGIVALNRIRVQHNLTPYAGAVTQAALITEMLNQRRYSLFAEGHRWIDMRRYNRLNQLPNDRPNDKVWDKFPIPLPESNQ